MGWSVNSGPLGALYLSAGKNVGLIVRRIGVRQGTAPALAALALNIIGGAGLGAGGTIHGIDLDSVRSWKSTSSSTDFVVPQDDYGRDGSYPLPFTSASVAIPVANTLGPLTVDVNPILKEIFARSGWREGYNVGFVIMGTSDEWPANNRLIEDGSAKLAITLDSLPAATSYRIEGHLAGQKIALVDGSLLTYNTLQGLKDLESQDIIVAPNGDANGVTVTLSTRVGTFSPASHTFVGSDPAVFRYTPTSTAFKHFIRGTNDGKLTDPAPVLFTVRRERLFPDGAIWYQPADAMGLDKTGLHERFAPYGSAALRMFAGSVYCGRILEHVVNYREGSAKRVPFSVNLYVSEADALPDGKLPMGEDIMIEGGPVSTKPGGDAHCLLFDMDSEVLHETYSTQLDGVGGYQGYHCQWDVTSLATRTPGFTSAAADGRPITPFLATYDEVLKAIQTGGTLGHPLRFTIPLTAFNSYVWDASHATYNGGSDHPKYGTRMRLKADYDISGFSPVNQAILRTLKKYGMYLGDGGLAWYLSSESDDRWNQADLLALGAIYPYTDFETVDQSPYMVSADSLQARTQEDPLDELKADIDAAIALMSAVSAKIDQLKARNFNSRI